MVVSKWSREERTVEKGYYPKYKGAMGELVRHTSMVCTGITNFFQLFDDLASWRGELKKATSNVVRAHYELFPPQNANLTNVQVREYVKKAATELIMKSTFAHGNKDDEVCLFFFLPHG